MAPAIQTRGLTAVFGKVPGILDLDLRVEAGEVFGFLGPNGAGKTTTIRLLLDLLRPDRGEARLFGVEVRAGGGALRARVGFLPGDLVLYPSLTGGQTLELFRRLHRRPAILREAVLERLGFDRAALGRKVRTYSTGMRQQLGIACAFQHDPELLVLDEPTSGLDPLVRAAFLDLVKERRDAGRTVFLSSHVLDEIDRCADRVALIERSRLRLVDGVGELRRRMPRTVRLRYADGTDRSFLHQGDPAGLLASIPVEGLVDLEVRPASLEEVFRSVIRGEGPS